MKKVKAIIGANYGDEGKGLLTRYFAIKEKNPIVILYHGSVNRGASLEKENDFHFPTSSFGAGILDNIPTFFSENFIISPIMFSNEYIKILTFNKPLGKIYVDLNCGVITPVDIILDQIRLVYLKNQNVPVSSCCAGNRSYILRKEKGIDFKYKDFINKDPIEICNYIFDNWFYTALNLWGIKEIPENYFKYKTRQSKIINGFYEQFICFKKIIDFFKKHTIIADFDYIYNNFDTLIFESSVGLKLTMGNSEQINATQSVVGLKEALKLLKSYTNYKGEACYVTRTYLTKHGGGNFPEETNKFYFDEKMNNNNEWQGERRFGILNYKEYFDRCKSDFKNANNKWKISYAITHINEIPVNKEFQKYFNYFSNTKYAEDIYENSHAIWFQWQSWFFKNRKFWKYNFLCITILIWLFAIK